jgi:hypothetical protein
MARSQSSSRPRPRKVSTIRRFTLREANRTLPLVSRIVADIVKTHSAAAQTQQRIEKSINLKEQAELHEQLEEQIDRLTELVEELNAVGCEIKDYQIGLVDFAARHQGRDVSLCWKLGEEQIFYWHELQAGYAGRQPVSILQED